MKNRHGRRSVVKLALGGVVLFLWARSYEHLFFEGPYRAFFLDQELFGRIQGVISDLSWLEFVNSPVTDQYILLYTRGMGWIWLLTSFLFLGYRKVSRYGLWSAAIVSSLGLLFYGSSDYLDTGYQLAQLIEYAAQIAMPILVVFLLHKGVNRRWLLVAKGAIALTFIGHGLYALGYFPVPGHFVYMTTAILGVSDSGARDFLFVIGVLDLVAVVLLFVPKIDTYALLYCILWGFLTALARPVAYIQPGPVFWISVHQSLYEFFVRLPHFILPLCTLWLVVRKERSTAYAAS